MVRNDIPLVERLPTKTGFLRKRLCCNCLGEKFVTDSMYPRWKCLSCGAINPQTFRLWIGFEPDPTGYEL